jgi:ureidoglycolate lyase
MSVSDVVVTCEPLCAAAFAPYGDVIEHAGTSRRHPIDAAYDNDGSAVEQRLWVSRLVELGRFPLTVKTMEQHPHSAQFFSPLSCNRYLVAVCPSWSDGSPNVENMVAFIARHGQGVVYRRNVWHHPMVALGSSAVFAVSMALGCADDTVFVSVDRPVTIIDA